MNSRFTQIFNNFDVFVSIRLSQVSFLFHEVQLLLCAKILRLLVFFQNLTADGAQLRSPLPSNLYRCPLQHQQLTSMFVDNFLYLQLNMETTLAV